MIIALPHRSLVRFNGPEAEDFLNDLITAAVPETAEDGVRPSALLTPQGRILFDFLIGRNGGDIVIELDDVRRGDFIKKMMMYRMRRNVQISADDRVVHASINDGEEADGLILKDSRFAQDVFRIYSTVNLNNDASLPDDWKAYRYRHGVVEGFIELPPEKALPLEARLDLNDGISFQKGCYIGQEVTARTRYRGLIKRCYLPVTLPKDVSVPHDIIANGKPVGDLIDTVTTADEIIGIAAIRLDALDGETSLTVDGEEVSVLYPERLMPLPERKKP